MQKRLDAKFLSAVVIMAVWFVLVLLGKAPAEQFVYALESVLASLGIFHAATAYQRTDSALPVTVDAAMPVAQIASTVGTAAAEEVAQGINDAAAAVPAANTEVPAQ
ncbi:hypothetical protein [Paludibacterium yongneupense]|uniref:hypothetical protein n=1 Tax=Paludibacterium yongneupense TaxID=400061 RepID=UPI00040F8CEB|nr:hypothetical protein [Paludibacterium yongneupense]